MKGKVPFVLINTVDASTKEISGHEYMGIKDQLGKEGEWKDWSGKDALRNYRDAPGVPPDEQTFVK
jgi:hypothetical protein